MHTTIEKIPVRGRTQETTIVATIFAPNEAVRATVLIPAAMGVTQKYYADFAAWLCKQGFMVATFDYRGIGLSAPKSLKNCAADITQWAEIDCAAMIDLLTTRAPNRALFVIGHSLGGQLVGMIPNRSKIDGVVLVGSGSGYWRETSPSTRRASFFMFYILAPVLTSLFGFFPGKRLRAVGDLPAGVVRQWRRWCLNPEYMIGVEGETVRKNFAELQLPMLSISFTDDEMMSATSTERLHRFYSSANLEAARLSPKDVGVKRIGHFGFFRKQFADLLWPRASDWLIRKSDQTP